MNAITNLFFQARLQTRLMLTLIFVVLLQAIISGSFTLHYIKVVLEDRIGDQALQLSRVVSALPQFRQGLIDREGIITTFNKTAVETLNLPLEQSLTGQDIRQVLVVPNVTIADCNPARSAIQYQ